MNTIVTSKEAILQECRSIVSSKGLSALNMRAVAQACGIALGSVYNYFSGKDELVLATIESVWRDIFHVEAECQREQPFEAAVEDILRGVCDGVEKYPNFFTAHSVMFASDEKSRAKGMMEQYFAHMRQGLTAVLRQDAGLRPNAFNERFTEADAVQLVFSGILLLMQRQITPDVLLEVLRRTLYEGNAVQ